jgi:hypothetical protein
MIAVMMALACGQAEDMPEGIPIGEASEEI